MGSSNLSFAGPHLPTVEHSRQVIQEYSRAVSDWSWQEHVQIVFILAVIIFGAAITIFQGLNKGWCKPATLILGSCVTILTSINTKFFDADYRVLKKSVFEGNSCIKQLNEVLDNRSQPDAVESELLKTWSEATNKFSGIQTAIEHGIQTAVEHGTDKTGIMIWEKEVYAQSAAPTWIEHPPSDKFNFYFTGTGEDRSLSAARQTSFDQAVALGLTKLAVQGQNCEDLRKFIASSVVIDNTAFEFDKVKSVYRFYTLLRISKEAKSLDLKNICPENLKPIVIAGATQWKNTAIQINKGDKLTFTATGKVQWAYGQNVGPRGSLTKLKPGQGRPRYQVDKIGAGGLVAKIGDHGTAFAVGEKVTIEASDTGTLWLGINDNDWKDNSGQFSVSISKSSAQ